MQVNFSQSYTLEGVCMKICSPLRSKKVNLFFSKCMHSIVIHLKYALRLVYLLTDKVASEAKVSSC